MFQGYSGDRYYELMIYRLCRQRTLAVCLYCVHLTPVLCNHYQMQPISVLHVVPLRDAPANTSPHLPTSFCCTSVTSLTVQILSNLSSLPTVILLSFNPLASMGADSASAIPMPRKLWEHPDPQSTAMAKFMETVNQKRRMNLKVLNSIPTLMLLDIPLSVCILESISV